MVIFIVEDNNFYAELLNIHLERKNNAVHVFSESSDCIRNLGKNPKLIILDFYLKDGDDGITILKEVKMRNLDTKIILLSGSKNKTIKDICLSYGAFCYLSKNIDSIFELDLIMSQMNNNKSNNSSYF